MPNTQILAGVITGTGNLVVSGAGAVLTLTGANTYTGNTIITNGGNLFLNGAGVAPANVVLATGGTMDETALGSYTMPGLTLTAGGGVSPTNNGNLNIPAAATVILNYANNGNASLTVSGGTLTLNGNNFVINGPVLANGTYNVMALANGGSIVNNGASVVIGTVIGMGHAAALTYDAGGAELVISTAVAPRTPTTGLITSSLNPSVYGNTVSFTDTITPPPAAGETITFSNGATLLGTVAITGGGAATLTVTNLLYSAAPQEHHRLLSRRRGLFQLCRQPARRSDRAAGDLELSGNPGEPGVWPAQHDLQWNCVRLCERDTQAGTTTGTAVFHSTTTTTSSPGSYAINGSGVTVTSPNYSSTLVQAPGNATALTINPIPKLGGVALQDGSTAITFAAGSPTVSQTVTVTAVPAYSWRCGRPWGQPGQ